MANSSFFEHLKNQTNATSSSPLLDFVKNRMHEMQKQKSLPQTSPFVIDGAKSERPALQLQKVQTSENGAEHPKQDAQSEKEPKSPIKKISRKEQFLSKKSKLFKMFELDKQLPNNKFVTLRISKKGAAGNSGEQSDNYFSETSSDSGSSSRSSQKDIYEK